MEKVKPKIDLDKEIRLVSLDIIKAYLISETHLNGCSHNQHFCLSVVHGIYHH